MAEFDAPGTIKKPAGTALGMLFFATLLVACQSPPPASVSYRQLQSQALMWLNRAIYAETVLSEAHVHPAAAGMLDQCSDWQRNMWALVQGADAFYAAALQARSVELDAGRFSPEAYEFHRQRQLAARRKIIRLLRSGHANELCSESNLPTLSAGQPMSHTQQQLVAYAAEIEHGIAPGSRVPAMALAAVLLTDSGRSAFSLEKRSRSSTCNSPTIYTLENHWPLETYVVLCPREAKLVECQWGDCYYP